MKKPIKASKKAPKKRKTVTREVLEETETPKPEAAEEQQPAQEQEPETSQEETQHEAAEEQQPAPEQEPEPSQEEEQPEQDEEPEEPEAAAEEQPESEPEEPEEEQHENADDFKYKKEEEAEPERKKDKKGKQSIKGNAIVTGIDIFFSRTLSFIAGETYQRFKLDEEEKKELNECAKDIEIKITPEILFVILLAAVYSTRISEAIDIRIKKNKEKKAEKQRAENQQQYLYIKQQPAAPQQPTQEAPEEMSKERKKFDVDENMFYKWSRGNVYLKKSLRREKATAADIENLLKCKANDITKLKKYFGVK